MIRAVLGFIVMVICGCSSNSSDNLSRSEASKLLETKQDLWESKVASFVINEGNFMSIDALVDNHVFLKDVYERLRQHGFIDFDVLIHKQTVTPDTGDRYLADVVRVEVKPKLKPFIKRTETKTAEHGVYKKGITYQWFLVPYSYTQHSATLPLWKSHLKEVVGIRDTRQQSSSGCDAIVEYTIDYSFTEFAEILKPNELPSSTEKKEACFKKFDDGWKLG